jgi:isopentenyl phosphate kinase
LSEPRPVVLKIGGSVITDKNAELAAKTHEINRLAEEIQNAGIKKLVIIHGGGSFGHPVAEKYKIKEGYKEELQKIGFSETHHVMTVLNGLFMDSLVWHNLPAVSVTPSSCIVTENGRITHFEDGPIEGLLRMDFIPVLYGDAVLDTKLGFTVLSGDQLVSTLAIKFNAERIVIGIDEDGVFDADPKLEKTAKMFSNLTLSELKKLQGKLGKATACDVTGGMFGKMAELIPAVEEKIPVMVVNAKEPRNVCRALQGAEVKGTLIKKE